MIRCVYCGNDAEKDPGHKVISPDGDFVCNSGCESSYRDRMKREMDFLADPRNDIADYLDLDVETREAVKSFNYPD